MEDKNIPPDNPFTNAMYTCKYGDSMSSEVDFTGALWKQEYYYEKAISTLLVYDELAKQNKIKTYDFKFSEEF